MPVTMKMELLNPYGSTCLLPISSPSSAKFAVSSGACRTHIACFSRTSWFDNTLTLPRSNTQHHKCVCALKKLGRRDAFCPAFAAPTVPAVKDDEGNSETDVQITEIKEPNCRVRLNVKVPPRICKESYEQILEELRKQTQIPGFRRGEKIPDKVLINFIGKQKIKTAAIEAVLNKTLPEAMSLVKDRALKDSEHIETKYTALQAAFSPSSFFSYDVAVDLAPEVKWTSPEAYKNLKVLVEVESNAAIERAAETELKARHKNLGSLKIVQGRGVKIGDVVVLDVSATEINEAGTDGDKLPFTEQKGFHLDTEESTHLVPGFVNAILGLETGQTRSFQLAFPDTWKQKELQGVLARFTVVCKELFYRDLPVLDDTLADKLVNGCSSLSQVQESFLQEHKQIAEAKKKQVIQRALLQELCKVVEMDIPHSLLEEHGRQLYGAKLIQLQITMKLTEDQILKLSSAKAVNNYLLSQKETIKESVKQTLAVEEIFNLENLQYSEEELEKEVEDTAAEFKSYNHEFDRDRIKEQAQEFLKGEKVLQFLMQHADIKYMLNDA